MERLRGFDAWLLYSETPTTHQHTLKIAVLAPTGDHPFSAEHLRRRFERRMHLLPPFRYRLCDIPFGVHHPMWLENCEIDLDHHIREHRVPAPGGQPEVDAVISDIVSTLLDRSRPMWEMHLLTGMAGGRVAIVIKMHHSLADGRASANLLGRAVEHYPDEVLAEHEPVPPDPVPGTGRLLRMAAADHARQLRELPGLLGRTTAGVRAVRTRGPQRPPDSADVLKPPKIFLNGATSTRRSFTTCTLPLDGLKAIRSALGVTLNDVFLALTAGVMRRLLLEHEGHAERPLVAGMAIGTDSDPNRLSGNKFSGMLISLPAQVADPVARARAAAAAGTVAKEQHRLLGRELIADWLAYLPPGPFRWYVRRSAERRRADRVPARFNVAISNVAGPGSRLFTAGYPVDTFWSVGPLGEGCGLNVTAWSYHDQFTVNVLADPALLGDPGQVTEGYRAAFEELRDAVAAADGPAGRAGRPSTPAEHPG